MCNLDPIELLKNVPCTITLANCNCLASRIQCCILIQSHSLGVILECILRYGNITAISTNSADKLHRMRTSCLKRVVVGSRYLQSRVLRVTRERRLIYLYPCRLILKLPVTRAEYVHRILLSGNLRQRAIVEAFCCIIKLVSLLQE